MRGWMTIVGFFGGLFALCWYGVTGETGPMGWLNGWQNAHTGSYSRGISFGILCVVCSVVGALLLAVWAAVARGSGARAGASPASFIAPADARIAAMNVAMSDRTRWRWQMYLRIWLAGLALVWAVVLGWQGWDFQRRAADASSDYTPLRLARTGPAVRTEAGSHWALQGRLLWDRSVTQTTKDRVSPRETVYVPIAGADWRPGDAIQFVLRLNRSQVWTLQHRADGADAPLRVRVEGALPTPSLAVFQRVEAPPIDAAVLVEVVDSGAGQPGEARPVFDWDLVQRIGLGVGATWTAGVWLGALAVLLKVWRLRRRQATPRL